MKYSGSGVVHVPHGRASTSLSPFYPLLPLFQPRTLIVLGIPRFHSGRIVHRNFAEPFADHAVVNYYRNSAMIFSRRRMLLVSYQPSIEKPRTDASRGVVSLRGTNSCSSLTQLQLRNVFASTKANARLPSPPGSNERGPHFFLPTAVRAVGQKINFHSRNGSLHGNLNRNEERTERPKGITLFSREKRCPSPVSFAKRRRVPSRRVRTR